MLPVCSLICCDLASCREARWLFIGAERNSNLSSIICTSSTVPRSLSALACGGLFSFQGEQVCPSIVNDVIIPGEVHMHALLSSATADNVFCIEPRSRQGSRNTQLGAVGHATHGPCLAVHTEIEPAHDPCTTEVWQTVVHCISMIWALRAISTAKHSGRVSCIRRARTSAQGGLYSSMDEALAPAAELGSLARGPCKALFMEDRPNFGICLDVPSCTKLMSSHLQWLLQQSGEYSCSIREGQLYSERLEQLHSRPRQRPNLSRPTSTVIVTGGTHGLGLHFARSLAANGSLSLVLTSRTAVLGSAELAGFAVTGRF